MRKMSVEELNRWCFACGPENPIGLKLTFTEEEDKYMARFTAGREHQGYDGVVHGGIVSTLLDEIMARYPYAKGLTSVTARLEVRYRQPTPVGVELTVTGRVVSQRGRIYEMAGTVALPDGKVTAEGKATVMILGK